jgi:hypothetical protein
MKAYTIKPVCKNSIIQEQYWFNSLSNERIVVARVSRNIEYGKFDIHLTNSDKETIMKRMRKKIDLWNYSCSVVEITDEPSEFYIDTINEDSYSLEEQEEIENLLYKWPEGHVTEDNVPEKPYGNFLQNNDDDEAYSEEKMNKNGWCKTHCHYSLQGDFVLGLKPGN